MKNLFDPTLPIFSFVDEARKAIAISRENFKEAESNKVSIGKAVRNLREKCDLSKELMNYALSFVYRSIELANHTDLFDLYTKAFHLTMSVDEFEHEYAGICKARLPQSKPESKEQLLKLGSLATDFQNLVGSNHRNPNFTFICSHYFQAKKKLCSAIEIDEKQFRKITDLFSQIEFTCLGRNIKGDFQFWDD